MELQTKKTGAEQTVTAAYRVSAKPLDFSFLKIADIAQLRKEVERSGSRRPIPESEDEEDQKKNDNSNALPADEGIDEIKAAEKEMVIRVPQVSQITSILANNNISLQQNKAGIMGGAPRKNEDTVKAGENAKKLVINKQTTTLFLQNNQIRTLAGDKPDNSLYNVLQDVMWTTSNLLWLDLSYNYLVNIEDEILKLPKLQTLYLQCNFIKNLEETRKLAQLQDLRSLNLFGNPIEQIPGYRMWVLGAMYAENDCLKRLDQVVITAKEFAAVCIWNERLVANGSKKLKKVSENYFSKNKVQVKAPPPLKVEEDEKGKSAAQGGAASEA